MKRRYHATKDSKKDARRVDRATQRAVLRQNLADYLCDKACVDCGEGDSVVLQFDHMDRSQKSLGISVMVGHLYSWNSIMTEISKCEIRCANCHLRRTAKQLGWHKAR